MKFFRLALIGAVLLCLVLGGCADAGFEFSDEWWHLEIDVKPWLELLASQAIEGTKYNVFRQAESVDDLYLTGMNIGFEALGSYDVEFEVKNFSLSSYVAKE